MTFLFPLLIACGGTSNITPASTTKAPAAPFMQAVAVDAAKLAQGLKVADAADGTEDKIAHKCVGCALSMDGKAEHAIEVDGTTLHLCSAMCKAAVVKDVKARLVDLAG